MKSSKSCPVCEWIKKSRKKHYVVHCLRDKEKSSRRSNAVVFALLFLLEVGLLSSNAIGFLPEASDRPVSLALPDAGMTPVDSAPAPDPAPGPDPIEAIEAMLERFEVDGARRTRVAQAIVSSSSKHNLDPRLVASVLIVESRGNPFAISSSDAVGIMQIHVPTWSRVVDQEGIDLFKIEDNIDFGARILGDYVKRYGHDEGVMRYNGWRPQNPVSVQNAEGYLRKVQHVYLSTDAALTHAVNAS